MRRSVVCIAAFLLFASCGSTVPNHQEAVEKGLAEVQQKVAGHLTLLERTAGTPGAAYERHTAFYGEVRARLAALRATAGASSGNRFTVEAIGQIEKNLDALEAAHREGLHGPELPVIAGLFASQFDALLRYEGVKPGAPGKEK